MIKNIKILNAFSLTEVLVTMFIIMLVIIASAPMITRKNAKNTAPHGVWECYLNASGQHVSRTNIDGQAQGSETVTNDYCVFEPQTNAKNYTVMVVGAGGGGASGTAFSMDKASYGSSEGYVIPADGQYTVLLVGGGGGGSAYLGGQGAKGGGAGGIKIHTANYKKGQYIVLKGGMGGDKGGSPDPENEAQNNPDSPESICNGVPGTGWKDICRGKDGEPSKLYIYSSNSSQEAEGGKGANNNSTGKNGGVSGCSSCQRSPNGKEGGYIDYTNFKLRSFINAENPNQVAMFGKGGLGIRGPVAGQGYNGLAMIVSTAYHAGGGGKRGTTAYMTLDKLTDEVKVYVGKGGEGALTEDTNGEQGENSSFGNYVTAKGGEGGKARTLSSYGTSGGIAGEDGAISPYGGTLSGGAAASGRLDGQNDMDVNNGYAKAGETEYGAGGGGGAALARSSSSGSSQGRWGKGGRGMPGYVRVEWN